MQARFREPPTMSVSDSFDFDHIIDRSVQPSEKWGRYAGRDVLPLWVADMDFAAPPVVIDALQRRIAHGVFGYTEAWPSLVEAVVEGLQREHAWTIEPDWLVWLPGVVSGFNLACAIAGEAGDGVVTATPVYPPFLSAPANTGRVLQRCELVLRAGRWQWDWEALERTVDARSRLLLLCSPHNPVGRVCSTPMSCVSWRILPRATICSSAPTRFTAGWCWTPAGATCRSPPWLRRARRTPSR